MLYQARLYVAPELMNAFDQTFKLAEDVLLRFPPTFDIKVGDSAVTAIERSTGAQVTAFLKPSAKGLTADRLSASVLALAKKKHPELSADGDTQAANGAGWTGQTQIYRTAKAILAPTRVLITCAILPATDPTQQRNLVVMVEVSDQKFIERLMYFRRFAETRVRVGSELSLEPVELPKELDGTAATSAPATTAGAPAARKAAAPPVKRRGKPQPEGIDDHEMLASAARGQRTLAISILLTFLARGIVNNPEVPALAALAISIAVLMYALGGVVKLCTGFGYSTPRKLVFMFFSTLPLINIGFWIYLSVKTTRRLRAAGYSVGLFGART